MCFLYPHSSLTNNSVVGKAVMQGKLIAVAYTLRKYWNQFFMGGICKQECNSVRLVSVEVKSIKLWLIINIIVSFDRNI